MSQSPTSAGSAISARDYTPIAYCNTPLHQPRHKPTISAGYARDFAASASSGKIQYPTPSKRHDLGRKMLPIFCDFSEKFHFQWGNADSRSEEQDFVYFSRLLIFCIKQQQNQIFSFVKSTNYLSNQQKYKKQQKIQRKITRFFKINFIFTAKSCN